MSNSQMARLGERPAPDSPAGAELSPERALRERVKQLNCRQRISEAVESAEGLEHILQASAHALSNAFFHSDIACARILLRGQRYQTESFRATGWRLSADLRVKDETAGAVEVCYLEERPARDEGPFLKAERNLINLCAERLGRVIERLEMSKALKEGEERFRALFEGIGDAVFVADAETAMVVDANPAALSLIGRTRDEALAMHQSQLHPPEAKAEVRQTFADAEGFTKRGELVEAKLRHADGHDIPVEIRTSLSFDINGQPCVIGVFRDITERERAEEATTTLPPYLALCQLANSGPDLARIGR